MGSGIAQASAQSGFYTILYELNPAVLEKAKERIVKDLDVLVEKQKINRAERDKVFNRIKFTDDLQICQADIFIEAIIEKPEAKIALFNQLAEINHSECIFATNTSSLSIDAIASSIKNPERMVGMHFFNPATIMKLVEVVEGRVTEAVVTESVVELAKMMGKTPVVCRDSPGFIVNRVARPYYIESLRLVEEGAVDIATIDALLESTGFRMGPFRLMDLIGNDINYAVSCSVYDQLKQPERLRPSSIQKEKVEKGELGKKTGRGYYNYG
ncbi:MAG: 3-hydroxybutyryl-CoA dehydrogenase [Chitinophagaceae bacterium]|nr:3-hydroxybutyryl-CoA dehydrogenase [Chitinophagaceae bacterium]